MATINHIGLTVSNLEASIDFYRDGVGMTEALRNDSVGGEWFDTLTNNSGARIKIAHLTLEGLTVQLVEYTAAGGDTLELHHSHVGNPHLCLNTIEFDEQRRRMEAHATGYISPVVQLGASGKRSFYCADPDGVLVEFIEASPN